MTAQTQSRASILKIFAPPLPIHSLATYLISIPSGAGTLFGDTHTETLQTAIRVGLRKVEGAGFTLITLSARHVVLQHTRTNTNVIHLPLQLIASFIKDVSSTHELQIEQYVVRIDFNSKGSLSIIRCCGLVCLYLAVARPAVGVDCSSVITLGAFCRERAVER